MARPTKPTEQKRRIGNPGKRALPAPLETVAAVTEIPRAPTGLGRAGRAAWKRIWTAGAAWLSVTSDWDLLVMIAEAYDTRELIKTALRDEPVFGETEKGFTFIHPGFAALRNADSQIAKWLGLCGFTPSDRSRLGLSEVKKQSKLEELLANRAQRQRSTPPAGQPPAVAG